MKATITRDTETSFFKSITNESGATFERKLEKGTTEYQNACASFHKNNVEIFIGNKIELN